MVLVNYVGGSEYEYPWEQTLNRFKTIAVFSFFLSVSMGLMMYGQYNPELISPLPVNASTIYTNTVVIDKNQNVDTWIAEAVDEFLPKRSSEGRKIMHCLANQESKHGEDKGHGDGGLAGGPFQFHEATWVGMRKQMIKEGHATEIGSRYDFKEAARTTAWAIANGRALEWGPILRESKGSNHATCHVPSWY